MGRILVIPIHPASGKVSGMPHWEKGEEENLPNRGYPCSILTEELFERGVRVLNTITVKGNSYWDGVPEFINKDELPKDACMLIPGYWERQIEE